MGGASLHQTKLNRPNLDIHFCGYETAQHGGGTAQLDMAKRIAIGIGIVFRYIHAFIVSDSFGNNGKYFPLLLGCNFVDVF